MYTKKKCLKSAGQPREMLQDMGDMRESEQEMEWRGAIQGKGREHVGISVIEEMPRGLKEEGDWEKSSCQFSKCVVVCVERFVVLGMPPVSNVCVAVYVYVCVCAVLLESRSIAGHASTLLYFATKGG